MPKPVAEYNMSLSIFQLKKWGFLSQRRHNYQALVASTFMGEKQYVQVTSYCNIKESFFKNDTVELKYIIPPWDQPITVVVHLEKTKCYFGGIRYWFRCIGIHNQPCGRRVGVIYKAGYSFVCRKCGNIAYASQNMNGTYRGTSFSQSDINKYASTVKRMYYRGVPTKKFKRLMDMQEALDMSFVQTFKPKINHTG